MSDRLPVKQEVALTAAQSMTHDEAGEWARKAQSQHNLTGLCVMCNRGCLHEKLACADCFAAFLEWRDKNVGQTSSFGRWYCIQYARWCLCGNAMLVDDEYACAQCIEEMLGE